MSSAVTRTITLNHLQTSYNDVTFFEIDGEVSNDNLPDEDSWIGLEFIGNGNELRGFPNSFREIGVMSIHYVVRSNKDGTTLRNRILEMASTLEPLLMNIRVGSVIFEEITPPNFADGAAIKFKKGFVGATAIVSYYRDYKIEE